MSVGSRLSRFAVVIFATLCVAAPYLSTHAIAGENWKADDRNHEFRFGLLYHEDSRFKRVMGLQNDSREGSVLDANFEILFRLWRKNTGRPLLDAALSPRVRAGASINFDDGTSHASVGLAWDHYLTDRVFVESALSIAVHDGNTGSMPWKGRMLGCSPLAHQSLSIGTDVGDRWRVMATVEHLDNFDLCHENAGLTNIGFRAGRRF